MNNNYPAPQENPNLLGLLANDLPIQGGIQAVKDWWNSLNDLQKAGLINTPAGVAGDMQMYAEDPESRNAINYAGTAVGSVPIVGLGAKQALKTLGSKVKDRRVGTTGQYVGAPAGMDSPQKLGNMRNSYQQKATDGMGGREWYHDSSEFIGGVTPDPSRAQQLADTLGVTSSGTNVDTNLGFAIKGINQNASGLPVQTGRFPNQMSPTIEDILSGNRPALGPKRQPFADNLSVEWNPDLSDRPVHDIWQGRAMGYSQPNGKPWDGGFSPQQHQFMDRQTQMVSDRMNKTQVGGFDDWDNLRTQAAAWTGEKLSAGDILPNEAARHYGSFAPKYRANATYEAAPAQGIGHMEGFANLPDDVKRAYTNAAPWTDQQGMDILYRDAGLLQEPTQESLGFFTPQSTGVPEFNPANTANPLVNMDGPTGNRAVAPESRGLLDGVERTRAFFDGQNGGAWNKAIPGNSAANSTGISIDTGGPITQDQLTSAIRATEPYGMMPIDTGRGVNVMNFSDATGSDVGKMLKGDLGESLNKAFPSTAAKRDTIDGNYLSFEDEWLQGNGAATRKLLEELDSTPRLMESLDNSQDLRAKVLANIDRDIQFGGANNMPPREDIQRARKIFADGGFSGLRKALESGVVLPAIALPILFFGASGDEQSPGGEGLL